MKPTLIEVKRDKNHHRYTYDCSYYLDPGSGCLFLDSTGTLCVGNEYKPSDRNRWRNGYGEVYEARPEANPVPETHPAGQSKDLKFDAGKPRWSLLMRGLAAALGGVVAVLTFGAKKYAAHSWRNVPNGEERYLDALYRHLDALQRGEKTDPESGLSHWSHVATNALFLHELEIQNDNAKP